MFVYSITASSALRARRTKILKRRNWLPPSLSLIVAIALIPAFGENNFQPALPTDCLIREGILKTRIHREKLAAETCVKRKQITPTGAAARFQDSREVQRAKLRVTSFRPRAACIREIDVCASSSSGESRSGFDYSADEGWSRTDIYYLLIITRRRDWKLDEIDEPTWQWRWQWALRHFTG